MGKSCLIYTERKSLALRDILLENLSDHVIRPLSGLHSSCWGHSELIKKSTCEQTPKIQTKAPIGYHTPTCAFDAHYLVQKCRFRSLVG
jgi:hypothetical protein